MQTVRLVGPGFDSMSPERRKKAKRGLRDCKVREQEARKSREGVLGERENSWQAVR